MQRKRKGKAMKNLESDKIIEHFSKSSENYLYRKGYFHLEHDPLIIKFIDDTCNSDSKILEVGGGNGYMLDLIENETSAKDLYNIELAFNVYKNQMNEKICLIGGDVLRLPFKSDCLDYIIIKNVFHHLVGNTRKKSKENVAIAIKELKRVVKNDGYIIVLEQYNYYTIFASIIFYITLILSRFNISLEMFQLRNSVIVSFLTPKELPRLLISDNNLEIVKLNEMRLKVSKLFKYTILMSNIGRLMVVGQVTKKH